MLNKNFLDALVIAQDFNVKMELDDILIEDKNSDYFAAIHPDGTYEICLSGLYNSGTDSVELDIDKILNIKKFIDELSYDGSGRNEIKAKTVSKLRDYTGAGLMECKEALIKCNGDVFDAMDYIQSGDYTKYLS